MCHNTTIIHRCGRHTSQEISYCRHAGRSKSGRRIMCNSRSHTRSDQRDSLCNKRNCRHRELNGIWTCCMCANGPNRYGRCVFERIVDPDTGYVINPCNHRPCDACAAY
ncbi:hypothetical protein F4778DRAFT_764678 [Xylariomycetidae sp. FL2044]|nr:hypothetical protein F4778DRAFT_764678 [Xylariomycetidae sp. FL2044]